MKLYYFLFIWFLCVALVLACHSGEDEGRRKKRQAEAEDVEQTRILRGYFSTCLQSAVGEIWDWSSVVDTTILDTFWYEGNDLFNCSESRNEDTASCWIARLRAYLRNTSFLMPSTTDCINQYAFDTSATANGPVSFTSFTVVQRPIETSLVRITVLGSWLTTLLTSLERSLREIATQAAFAWMEKGPEICMVDPPPPYDPNAPTFRSYVLCNQEEIAIPSNRPQLDFPSVFQFVQGHTICSSELADCNNDNEEALTMGEEEIPRWPYRLEALVKSRSPLSSAISLCNNEVFPRSEDWSSWTGCSMTCGGGTKTRSRICVTPGCERSQTETCSHTTCPKCRISMFSRRACPNRVSTQEACIQAGCCYGSGQCYRARRMRSITPRTTTMLRIITTPTTGTAGSTVCSPTSQLDLSLIVDESGSIGGGNFEFIRSFLLSLVNQLPIGLDRIRVALTLYSSGSRQLLHFNQAIDAQTLIQTINNANYAGGGTQTGGALQFAASNVFILANGDRPNVADVAILLTDGESSGGVEDGANALKDKGVRVIAIGVGGNINTNELNLIASDPDNENVFLLSGFTQLLSIVSSLGNSVCS